MNNFSFHRSYQEPYRPPTQYSSEGFLVVLLQQVEGGHAAGEAEVDAVFGVHTQASAWQGRVLYMPGTATNMNKQANDTKTKFADPQSKYLHGQPQPSSPLC